jgi:hypothetical protein
MANFLTSFLQEKGFVAQMLEDVRGKTKMAVLAFFIKLFQLKKVYPGRI